MVDGDAQLLPERDAEAPRETDDTRSHAQAVARAGRVRAHSPHDPQLLSGIPDLEVFLRRVAAHFRSASEEVSLSHAAEWVLDNFHLAQQALRQVTQDMPAGFYRRLPVLAEGLFAGYPRVYEIGQQIVAESGARLDLERARDYLQFYQEVTPLTTAELWAMPVMLRLSLINALADVLAEVTGIPRLPAPPALPRPAGPTRDELVGYCFTGLRAIAQRDWQRFFEAVSPIEAILREDPSGIYACMDRETRDRYRTVVEKIARASGKSEPEVAGQAIALATAALSPVELSPVELAPAELAPAAAGPGGRGAGDGQADWLTPPAAHVGYYLVDEGRTALESAAGHPLSSLARLDRPGRGFPAAMYIGPVLALAALLVLLALAYASGTTPWFRPALIVLLALVPALTASVVLVDWLVTLLVPPRTVPKLDFEGGIPGVFRTVVAVPAMLDTADGVRSLLEQLEVYLLGNSDPNIGFALVTDFVDAGEKELPADAALLEQVRAGVRQLNDRYRREPAPPFFLLHRERRWNPGEDRWMGWERKRGKLHEFNHWLRGDRDTSFVAFEGDLKWLSSVRYVITLDADTVLPSEAARRLTGALAHPLNRAELDPRTRRVVRGYGLLQPRTEITPRSANESFFSRAFAGDIGLDLYTLAVSNVYQDLFGSGIYVGKGIYDVDAFESSLSDRVPENSLLSHDLFEGLHARVGLVTDIVVYEDYPPSYLAYASRLVRWTRGDWQLLPLLLPRARGAESRRVRNEFSAIDLWKVLDNLRRSLLPPALLMLLIAGWLGLAGSPWVWAILVVLTLALPALLGGLTPFILDRPGAAWGASVRGLRQGALRSLLAVIFLPFEALQLSRAIAITLARVLITRRNLLQWTTSAEAARQARSSRTGLHTWRSMWGAAALAGVVGLALAFVHPAGLPAALPLLVVWLLAPEVAWRISRPVPHLPEQLSEEQLRRLSTLARRTWLFFERFVGPEDHWLPPDHIQEAPSGVSAPYTSPTNIGMLLLGTLAAYDLGFIGFPILVARLQFTFETLARLERHRGHFLNWYGTRTLEPLLPRYVSTVDSGNLAACLMILARALREIPGGRVLRWRRWEALASSFALLDDPVRDLVEAGLKEPAAAIGDAVASVQQHILAARADPSGWWPALQYAAGDGWQQVDAAVRGLLDAHTPGIGADELRRLRIALEAIRYQVYTLQRYVNILLPWLPARHSAPRLLLEADDDVVAPVYARLVEVLDPNPALRAIPEVCGQAQAILSQLQQALEALTGDADEIAGALAWCGDLHETLGCAQLEAETFLDGLRDLIRQADELVECTDFTFLFEPRREVFHIGYNVTAGKLDDNHYDLLASESRIASFIALAKHDVPPSHWLHLARPLTQLDGTRTLLSWSATLFEYLMPPLLMRSYPGTLLRESELAAVDHQIRYARSQGVPWGISESGYYAFDAGKNYQYRAFGVPGLGFKRNLAEDLVVAPYASLLALAYRPQAVAGNIDRLIELGALGAHGFYESIDFTKTRLTLGQDRAIVREYMAHHQGMILLSLANYLDGNRMVERFHADPRVKSAELLLQERVPPDVPMEFPQTEESPARRVEPPTTTLPWSVSHTAPAPEVHYLSNGRYGVLITAAGAGFSHWNGFDLTRWRPDTTLEESGTWVYVQDEETGDLWSAAYQPTAARPGASSAHFHAHMAEFRRTDQGIGELLEIAVAPEADVEIRRLTLVNESDRVRRLAVTSYAEVVMAPQGSDVRHPAFNSLFIESEYLPELGGLLFRRRPRSASEEPVFLVHCAGGENGPLIEGSYESDRMAFLGRGGTARAPAALATPGRPLGGTSGATLDPAMALRRVVEIGPGEQVRLVFLTAAAASREEAVRTALRYAASAAVEDAFSRARELATMELDRHGLSTLELARIEGMLAALLYPRPALRVEPDVLAANAKGQPGLWAYGISGDYPVLLVRVRDEDDLGVVVDLLNAHSYWRRRLLKIDLVILIDKETGYSQELRNELHRLLVRMQIETWLNQRGGIFILFAPQLPEVDRALLLTVARVVLDPARGTLGEQIEALHRQPRYLPPFNPEPGEVAAPAEIEPLARPTGLRFDNGTGGFSPDGREYVIFLEPGRRPPLPWSNVLANPEFGCLVTDSGSSCTWSLNSGENRLTPWSNDPVSDPSGEALYLRDEETGEVWSPTPLPAPASAPHLVRHGHGYTIFEHHSHALAQRVRVFVPPDDPVKIVVLRLENTAPRPRRVTATYYAEWVLGVAREAMQPYVVSGFEAETQALLARNTYNTEFAGRVAFLVASKVVHGLTADRAEFLGRHGSRTAPAGLARIGLSGTVHAGIDPCAAIQVHLDLAAGQAEEIWFVLGQGSDHDDALRLAAMYKQPEQVTGAWEDTLAFWNDLLGTVQVETPDPALDLLLNRWLPYQALACRIWGRTAFYQSSGAYGFRDQLQDVMATVHAAPQIARNQILEAARHQFEAGDVLHWWHPPTGRGVRTRCSDDLLWLPFVTAHYVRATADVAILQEDLPFLRAAPLEPAEEQRYGQYEETAEKYSLYEHCRRAIQKGATAGAHGLPLMGTGDWNDGMDRVGIEGRGESVWLGWFLHATLAAFAGLCELQGEAELAQTYRERADALSSSLEEHGWDGAWYLRAFYDDGAPLGSAGNEECRIDSIAQSWAVLSGAGDGQRSRKAMRSVREQLVRPQDGLILLFTPPFDKTPRDPGYIKGYLPGIRENGGQYTHAALWATWAFAELGEGAVAGDLFRLLNPIYHADTADKMERYKVEPYVVAADVYGVEPHTGRGGWTWYTGSAAWMYRLGIEGILGVRREGDSLQFQPRIPADWQGFTVQYRFGGSTHRIRVQRTGSLGEGAVRIVLDGRQLPGTQAPLTDDGGVHEVEVWLG